MQSELQKLRGQNKHCKSRLQQFTSNLLYHETRKFLDKFTKHVLPRVNELKSSGSQHMKSVWVVFFQLLRDIKAIHKLVGASFIGHLLDTVKHLHLNKNHGKNTKQGGLQTFFDRKI